MTVFMLLTLVSQSGPIRHRTFTFCRHAYKNFPHSGGTRFWAGTCHPKHSTGTKQSQKKNETAAGVALVLAAAVSFAMCVGHQLLGEEVLELHQHLVAPVPDRRPAWTQCCTINWIPIYCVPFSCRDLRQSEELRTHHLLLDDDLRVAPCQA